jgi:hypothetical protein
MKRGLAALGALLVLAAAGCYLPGDDTGRFHGFGVENRSSETVDVEYTAPTGEKFIVVRDLLAYSGTALIDSDSRVGECNEGTLQALDASGRLVAETSERLCDGDLWIIPADPSPS